MCGLQGGDWVVKEKRTIHLVSHPVHTTSDKSLGRTGYKPGEDWVQGWGGLSTRLEFIHLDHHNPSNNCGEVRIPDVPGLV